MSLSEWYYLPIAALTNSLFYLFWQKKMGLKKIHGFKTLSLIFFGSLFNAWGLDVIQRMLEIFTIVQMMKISLGCWLMIAAATSAKHYAVNGWSKKNFWIDYGGDLIGFMIMGLIIYALT
ncbi:MAG: DUF1761 family protein [Bacteriovorax sp.]|nr:DUF1761 family protein [Bacteriovorax sp.]